MNHADREVLITRISVLIEQHTPDHPISSKALSEIFSMSVRDVNAAVQKLIYGGKKVRSWRGGFDKYLGRDMPAGYSLARTPEEIRATADMLFETAESLKFRALQLMNFGTGEPCFWQQEDAA